MDYKLTTHDVWLSTWIFGVLGLLALIPLVFLYREASFRATARPLAIATAIFWGILATAAFFGFWDLYYQYLYPDWTRWLAPLDTLLYAALGLGMWWLALRLPGPAIAWFAILGGLEGVIEHILGIYGLHILEQVPWLQEVTALPVLVFSFGEYVLYWSLVGWLAFGLTKVGI
jgi:hypothetical protein